MDNIFGLQRKLATLAIACLGSALICAPLRAQTAEDAPQAPAGEGIQTYPRAFFNRFNPQTALDLIERLPGFSLDAGDDDLRGFGGTAGNVLIDGERPSSKSGGIEDALRRIPASQVERIEVIRGSAGLSEAAGQAVVANVVRERGSAAGSWEAKLERAADGIVYPAGEVTIARQLGAWDTSTKLNAFWERFPLEGPRIQRDANGDLLSSQLEDRPSVFTQGYISTDADRPLGGGTLTVTGRAGRSEFLPDTERLGFDGRLPDGSPDDRLFIDFDSIFVEAELGIDWTRSLDNDWSLKLLSFSSVSALDDEQIVTTERPVGELVSVSTFALEEDAVESIIRGTFGKVGGGRFRPEFGGELTYNRLDSALALEVRTGDEVSEIELPAANVRVEEIRGEAFANLIWRATDKLSVETGLAVEASEISVSGDASNTQRFVFPKPFATLIYDVGQGVQLRAGIRRTVGQLDFSEFAASASAEDDRFLGGNPELGPDQTTRSSLTLDIRSDTRGALNIELFYEMRDDVIEQVLLPSGAFGADNAGSGEVWGVTANTAIPLTRFIPGGLIEVEADIRDSSFDDPLTGSNRVLSNVRSPTAVAEFRQDLTDRRIAWGIAYRFAQDNVFYFADEESFTTNGGRWGMFIETTRFWGVRTNFAIRNPGGRNFFRKRRFFDPSRAGEFVGTETISRDRGIFVTLTMTGQFR